MYYVYRLTVRYKNGSQNYEVCKCAEKDTAQMIADALNDAGKE